MESLELFKLDGKVAVVTGALGLLGPVYCQGLLDAGARVVGIDLESAPMSERFVSLQQEFGPDRIGLLRADITKRSDVEKALDECIKRNAVPSILVNNAGIDQPPSDNAQSYYLEEVPLDVSSKILEVNVLGTLLMIQVFGGAMKRHEIRGSIINIGSQYAEVVPDPHFYDHIETDPPFLKPLMYGPSKAAVDALTRRFAVELGRFGIRVNSLSPGGIFNNQDPEFLRKFSERVPLVRSEYSHRMGFDYELIGPLLFLASDASSYMTGENLRVNGGFTAL